MGKACGGLNTLLAVWAAKGSANRYRMLIKPGVNPLLEGR